MASTYWEYTIEEGDSPELIRKKLYLGIISVGETAYTLGAAIAEMRKQVDAIDRNVRELHADYDKHKHKLDEASRGGKQ